jgi:hypothetical protein
MPKALPTKRHSLSVGHIFVSFAWFGLPDYTRTRLERAALIFNYE